MHQKPIKHGRVVSKQPTPDQNSGWIQKDNSNVHDYILNFLCSTEKSLLNCMRPLEWRTLRHFLEWPNHTLLKYRCPMKKRNWMHLDMLWKMCTTFSLSILLYATNNRYLISFGSWSATGSSATWRHSQVCVVANCQGCATWPRCQDVVCDLGQFRKDARDCRGSREWD